MRATKIAAALGVLGMLLLAQHFGLWQLFAEPVRMKQTLLAAGPWGYAAFIGAYTLLQPFGLPGTVFIMAAPLIWPWPVAFALSMVGTMAASVVGFVFARFVAGDFMQARIPARFRRYDQALARHAFGTVFWMRLVFWMPPWLHAFFGVSAIGFGTHFWASLAGYVPPLLLVSYFGQQLFDALRHAPAALWLWLGLGALLLTAAVTLIRRRAA
ncbi:MAG TPA: VTT domain-containing protein [Polyangiales bacterium]